MATRHEVVKASRSRSKSGRIFAGTSREEWGRSAGAVQKAMITSRTIRGPEMDLADGCVWRGEESNEKR
jgi:hypothetical protein